MSIKLSDTLKRWRLGLGLVFIVASFALAQDEVSFYNSGTEDDWSREFSAERSYNIKTVPSPTRSGATALRMEARYGEKENGYHSEMERWDAGSPGETRWYGFSTYVPTSWVDSEQVTVTTQWWSHSPASPPLALEIHDQTWVVSQRWAEEQSKGLKQAVGAVQKGVWNDWVVQADWSSRDDGYLKVWRNGEVVYERRGPSVYRRTESLRFKLGVYVWPWKRQRPSPELSDPRVIYHDEIRVGDEASGYDAVKPR